jgi:signal transduction histidine kinase
MIRIPKLSSIQSRFGIIFPALLLLSVIFGSLTKWLMRKSVVFLQTHLENSPRPIETPDLQTPAKFLSSEDARLSKNTIKELQASILPPNQDMQKRSTTLENRIHNKINEQEALAAISTDISPTLPINEVFKSVTTKAQELSNSEVASLCLLDQQLNLLNLRSFVGSENAFQQSQSQAEGLVIQEGLLQTQPDATGMQNCRVSCQIIAPQYRASHLAAPLRSDHKVIGALCVGSSKPDAFQPEVASTLSQLARLAARTIENVSLYQQAEQAGTLEERQRVASEMHDGLLQTLSFLGMMVRSARDQMDQGDFGKAYSTLQQIERAEEQAEQEIRRAIAGLKENFPINKSLQEQLTIIAEELSASNPPVLFETDCIVPLMLVPQESEQVLRIVREGLLNAQRHSQSELVRLLLNVVQNEITITIKDQGIGFDPSIQPNDNRPHFGIKIMKARAVRLGAELIIQPVPGTGTIIQLRWTPKSAIHHQEGRD